MEDLKAEIVNLLRAKLPEINLETTSNLVDSLVATLAIKNVHPLKFLIQNPELRKTLVTNPISHRIGKFGDLLETIVVDNEEAEFMILFLGPDHWIFPVVEGHVKLPFPLPLGASIYTDISFKLLDKNKNFLNFQKATAVYSNFSETYRSLLSNMAPIAVVFAQEGRTYVITYKEGKLNFSDIIPQGHEVVNV